MKKVIPLILALVMCLSLCTHGKCEESEVEKIKVVTPKGTTVIIEKPQDIVEVIRNDGTTETLTSLDLAQACVDNEVKFEKNYVGAFVKIIAPVEEVHGRTIYNGHTLTSYVELSGGWIVEVAENHPLLEELSRGDMVVATGRIYSGGLPLTYEGIAIKGDCKVYSVKGTQTTLELFVPEEEGQDTASEETDTAWSEQYADVLQALSAGTWFFNGGSDAAVNRLQFENNKAVITQFYSDGDGFSNLGNSYLPYTINETAVIITLADGSELVISYQKDADGFLLGNGEYLTPEEVDAGLQGYWGLREKKVVMNLGESEFEYIFYFDNGKVVYEYANEAYGHPGQYYYTGPNTGTYTMDENGFNVDAKNNWQFAFNVIDGKAVFVRCGSVSSPVTGFKGQNGYSF